ncbi:SURF1 family protein [Minwuia sp.]|uniref:SURF1 family protein n=1 Tax=Minwuia sp. TaxID=2493630 RepID=UPI003A94BE22
MRFRPSIPLTVSAAIAFAILCGLGIWQLQRLDWKNGLIEQIAARMDGAAVPLPAQLDEPDDWRFRRVTVTGTFDHAHEAHRLGKAERGRVGYRIFTPLIHDDGQAVMVERGWVPDGLKSPDTRPASLTEGSVTVTGVLRLPDERNLFTPDDDPVRNLWSASDPVAMGAAAGLQTPPWYVVAEESGVTWPRAGRPELHLINNHLEYAFTWFSLAVVLLVIWLIMGLRRAREQDQA